MFYLTIYAVTALLAFNLRHTPQNGRAWYPVLLAFFLLFAAFRFEVGCDWTGYLNQFFYGAFQADPTSPVREPLWWIYLRAVSRSGLSYPWLNVLPTAIFFVGVHMLARRQPDRFALLVLLWPILIINIAMSGIRQAAAIGLICIAFNAFVERRVVWFVVWVLLASLIHSSSMIFLLLVPLVNGTYSRGRLVLAALLAIPGAILMINSPAGEVGIDRYVGTDTDAAGAAFRVALLALTGVAFFAVLRRPWLDSKAADFKLASIGSFGMIATAAVLPLSTIIADRLGYYFVPIQAIIFARIPFLPLRRSSSFYLFIAYAALGVTLAVWVLFSNHYARCYVPYKTWLFGMPESRLGL